MERCKDSYLLKYANKQIVSGNLKVWYASLFIIFWKMLSYYMEQNAETFKLAYNLTKYILSCQILFFMNFLSETVLSSRQANIKSQVSSLDKMAEKKMYPVTLIQKHY